MSGGLRERRAYPFHKMKKPLLGYVSATGVGNLISPFRREKPTVVSSVDGVVALEIGLEEPVEQHDVEEVCAGGRQHLHLSIFWLKRFRNA